MTRIFASVLIAIGLMGPVLAANEYPYLYDETAASNTEINGISVAEGMNPSAVNNAIREQLSQFRELLNDIFAQNTSAGTNTITLTTDSTLTALEDGVGLMFIAGGTNSGAVTFSPDGLTAKAIVKGDGAATALAAGDIVAGMPVFVVYDASVGSGSWLMLNPVSGLSAYLSNVVEDTTPQLGGDLDANGNHVAFDDADGVNDENGNEQIVFQTTGSAVTYLEITNNTTGNGPTLGSNGETNVDLNLIAAGTGVVQLADETLARPKILDYGETVNALGDLGGGSDNIDLTLGNVVTATISTSTSTLTITNWPASGTAGSVTMILTNAGSQTTSITNAVWAGGTAPSFTASGVDIVSCMSINAGTTVYCFNGGLDFQ